MNPNLELPGKAASQVGLSPFETVVAFDPVRPLARVPVPAGQGDDLSKGPYVLAFRSEVAWRRAWRTCKEKIETQCQAGAMLGCSISAAQACGRPWWKASLPFLPSGVEDPSTREECEAREMRGCLVSAQARCSIYARETCDPAFADMRIAAPGAPIDRRFSGEPLRRPRVTRHDKLGALKAKSSSGGSLSSQNSTGVRRAAAADAADEDSSRLGVTSFRGRLVMQQEPPEERESIPNRSVFRSDEGLATQNLTGVPQAFPKEGWVGGLVHPAPRRSPAEAEAGAESEKAGSMPKGPVCVAVEWWQRLQQSVVERLSIKRVQP